MPSPENTSAVQKLVCGRMPTKTVATTSAARANVAAMRPKLRFILRSSACASAYSSAERRPAAQASRRFSTARMRSARALGRMVLTTGSLPHRWRGTRGSRRTRKNPGWKTGDRLHFPRGKWSLSPVFALHLLEKVRVDPRNDQRLVLALDLHVRLAAEIPGHAGDG